MHVVSFEIELGVVELIVSLDQCFFLHVVVVP